VFESQETNRMENKTYQDQAENALIGEGDANAAARIYKSVEMVLL